MGIEDAAPDEGSTGDSLRDTLTAAFDASEATSSRESTTATEAPISTGTPTPSEPPAEGTTTSTAPREDGRDAQGRFAPKAATSTEVPAKGPSTATAPDLVKPAPSATPPVPAPPEALKAPQSWKPAAREKWAALPPEAQSEIVRRERETATVLQEAAESRRLHQAFQQAVGPYEGMIRSEGAEPLQAVASLLRTAHALRTAPMQHRAGMLADMAHTFGIPIEALDAALVARAQGRPMAQQQQPMQDPRFDQFLAHLQQQKAQRDQQQSAQYQAKLGEFAASHEFYDDVREEMADMLEVASRRGIAMDWEEAYSRAVLVNPSTKAVVDQRRAAEAANAQAASTQRARAAASSVKSQPVGPRNGHLAGGSLRDDISAAWVEHEGR